MIILLPIGAGIISLSLVSKRGFFLEVLSIKQTLNDATLITAELRVRNRV